MATRRILRPEDELPRAAHLAKVETYTDAQARQLGYPSATVLRLAYQLSAIVGEWRATQAEHLVTAYHSTLYKMILNGYNVETLPIQDQLPPALMPELPPKAVQTAIQQAYQLEP